MARPRKLNLRINDISLEAMEEIASSVEDAVNAYLREHLPVDEDFSIVVSIEREGDSLNIAIDVGVRGALGNVVNYEEFVENAIQYARKRLEEKLKDFTARVSSDSPE
ncbi:MAG: DUF3194 domain-containing protein [Thermosphaera sp.]